MKKIGYMRISTSSQKPDRQINGLEEICDELHLETVSARSSKRPVFEKLLKTLEPDQTLVVWDLDRAFRSVIDAITTAEKLRKRGVHFQIVSLNVDTTTPAGELLFTIMSAAAQFEQRLISERTKEGLAAARKRGVRLGRPRKLKPEQLAKIKELASMRGHSRKQLAKRYGVSIWTIRRILKDSSGDSAKS
ncbi:MAG: recombinase family protein [Cohaesibacter sp.]|nr:recombinase family protein [Cohaesibacter sp.]